MKFLGFLLVLLAIAGCSPGTSSDTTKKLEDAERVPIKYAKNFGLKRSGDLFLLELYEPGTKKIVQTIEINPKKNQRIISLTSTLNGMVCILDERDRIMGVSSKAYLYDPQLIQGVNSGRIKEFGDITKLSVEKIVANAPNLILYDIVSQEFPNQEKLERLNIQVLPIYDWREEHPLAKAEWIKVVGAITGKFEEAENYFNSMEMDYISLKEFIGTLDVEQPTVLCGTMIGDVWYTPSGDNYFAQLIADAGGNYRYASTKGTKSLALPLEQILKENKETDFWLNPGFADKKAILEINPHAHLLGAWNDHVYCYSANMNKFWEQSAANPNKVLYDIAHILHPLPPEADTIRLNYYAKVAE